MVEFAFPKIECYKMETFLYCDLTFKNDWCRKEEDKMWSNAGINHQINLQCGEKGPKLQLLFSPLFFGECTFCPFCPSFFRKPNDLWFFSKFRAAAAATAAAAGEENGTDDPTPLFSF